MAAGDPYVTCDNTTIGWRELLWAISTKTAAGAPGIRVYSESINDDNLVGTVPCDGTLESFEQWLRLHVVLDANDKPALHLITGT